MKQQQKERKKLKMEKIIDPFEYSALGSRLKRVRVTSFQQSPWLLAWHTVTLTEVTKESMSKTFAWLKALPSVSCTALAFFKTPRKYFHTSIPEKSWKKIFPYGQEHCFLLNTGVLLPNPPLAEKGDWYWHSTNVLWHSNYFVPSVKMFIMNINTYSSFSVLYYIFSLSKWLQHQTRNW